MATYCAVSDVLALFPNSDAALGSPLQSAIIDASAWVENQTQRVLAQATYTEQYDLIIDNRRRILGKVQQWPITAVTALSVTVQGTQTPIVLDTSWVTYQIAPERLFWYAGPLVFPPVTLPTNYPVLDRFTPGSITFTYTAGYSPIPQDVVLAAALVAQYLVMQDANPMGAQSINVSMPGGSHSVTLPGDGSQHMTLAKSLITRYIKRD